jgi:hypothetical protein
MTNSNVIIEEFFDNNHNPKQMNTANPHYLQDCLQKMSKNRTLHTEPMLVEQEKRITRFRHI